MPFDVLYLILLILLLVAAALFSATETAFSSANVIRVKQLALNGNEQAKMTYLILKEYNKVITAILICNNVTNILATAIMTFLMSRYFPSYGVLIATVIMTVMIIVFGEIIPKLLAKNKAEDIAIAFTPVMSLIIKALSPIIKVAINFQDHLMEGEDKVTATEDELLQIVATIEKEGVLEQEERELIESAITFDEKTVREVMRPLEDTIFLYDNATEKQIIDVISKHKYSRIPVVGYATLQAVGIIRERDILDLLLNNKRIRIKNLIRSTLFVSQRTKLPDLLERLQKKREHMAIVVENKSNNNLVGIVTLEDILEELVGEIYDEYDDLPNFVVEIGRHTFEIKGTVPLKQFFDDYLDSDPPPTKARNFSSWVNELAKDKKIKTGSELEYDNYKIKVLATESGIVTKLELEVLSKNTDMILEED